MPLQKEIEADRPSMLRVLKKLTDALDAETALQPVTTPTLLFVGTNFLKIIILNLNKLQPGVNWKAIAIETLPQILEGVDDGSK